MLNSVNKLYLIVIILVGLCIKLSSETWTQSTKTEFNQGIHSNTVSLNGSGSNGNLQLLNSIYNGWFNENGGSYDGWEDASMGNGTIINNIVNATGRTSISYNYASYSAGASWAKKQQYVANDLDNLSRFHLDVYPISSQCSGSAKLKVRVQAFDSLDNPLLDTNDPSNVIEYILYGTPHAGSTFDWHSSTGANTWNYYIWNLKAHIIYFLSDSYSWSDVSYVRISYESYSGDSNGSNCGAYWDAFWAAHFVDDNFDDNYVNPGKWIEREGQISITEQNNELRFHGTSHYSNWNWSYLKTQETIDHSDHQYTESSIDVRLQNFSASNSVFFFMLEDSDEQNHFRLIAQPGMGYRFGWRIDGNWYTSNDVFPFLGIESSTTITWRIIYDSTQEIAYGLINGTFIGSVNVPLNNYRVKMCHDIQYAGQYFDIRVDDFTFIKSNDSEYETKYAESGTFISSAHDTGSDLLHGTIFDQISWSSIGETIKFQIRTAETYESLLSETWFGPENNPTGWYETSAVINSIHDYDRWIQYKADLSTNDQTLTPSLNDVSIAYHKAVGITFTFANVRITDGGNFFEFDIMANATDTGTKLGIVLNSINYNSIGFDENIIGNGFAEVSKGALLEGEIPGIPGEQLYFLSSMDETNSRFQVNVELNPLTLPSILNELPLTPTQLFHIKIEIQDNQQNSDFSFQSDQMVNQQIYSDLVTTYNPVLATDTCNSPLSIVPQNVKISIREEMIRLTWNEVPEALYYNIYSTLTPKDPLSWILEDSDIHIPFWTQPLDIEKNFFYVTAVFPE